MAVDEFVRSFLAIFFTLVAVRYALSTLGRNARTGERYLHYGEARSRARLVRITFNAFRATIWAMCVVRVFTPSIDVALGAFTVAPALKLLGVVLLLVSLAGVEYVHAYMQDDWRSGVPTDGPRHLIDTGPYAATRNPIFFCVMLGQLGFALALPSVFSLVCLVVGVAVLTIQMGVEERALMERFGQRYAMYMASTPRLLPRLGLAARGGEGVGGAAARRE